MDRGIFTFTIELWDLPTEAGIKDRKFIEWYRKHPHEDDLKIIQWVDENVGPGGYIEWYPFDHPQLGKVELGGWNALYTRRNPPHAFMGSEAERNVPFAIAFGKMLPKLEVHTLESTRLSDDVHHLKLVIENTGFLPTFTSNQGKLRKAIRPIRIKLDHGENVKIIEGKKQIQAGHLEGRANKLEVTAIGAASPTDNRFVHEWVIKAEKNAEMELKILSERAGNIIRKLTF